MGGSVDLRVMFSSVTCCTLVCRSVGCASSGKWFDVWTGGVLVALTGFVEDAYLGTCRRAGGAKSHNAGEKRSSLSSDIQTRAAVLPMLSQCCTCMSIPVVTILKGVLIAQYLSRTVPFIIT